MQKRRNCNSTISKCQQKKTISRLPANNRFEPIHEHWPTKRRSFGLYRCAWIQSGFIEDHTAKLDSGCGLHIPLPGDTGSPLRRLFLCKFQGKRMVIPILFLLPLQLAKALGGLTSPRISINLQMTSGRAHRAQAKESAGKYAGGVA